MKYIYLKTPAIFSFSECLWFLDRGFDESTHTILNNRIYKYCKISDKDVLLNIGKMENGLEIGYITESTLTEAEIIAFVSDWFDLKADLLPFYSLLENDVELKVLSDQYYGLRLISIPNFFETIIWSIIGQQINLTFAYKMKKAIVYECGQRISYEGIYHCQFPEPKDLLGISDDRYREMQFSKQKVIYIKIICEAFVKGKLHISMLQNENENKQAILTQFKGIGEWTAQYVLMKHLRIGTSIPYGDSGINQALFNLKNIPKKNNRPEQEMVFAPFSEYSSYLVFYLWRSLSKIHNT